MPQERERERVEKFAARIEQAINSKCLVGEGAVSVNQSAQRKRQDLQGSYPLYSGR